MSSILYIKKMNNAFSQLTVCNNDVMQSNANKPPTRPTQPTLPTQPRPNANKPQNQPTQPVGKKNDPKSAKSALKRQYGDVLKKIDSQFNRIESHFDEWRSYRHRRANADDHSYDTEISALFTDIRNGVNNIASLHAERHDIKKMIAECVDE